MRTVQRIEQWGVGGQLTLTPARREVQASIHRDRWKHELRHNLVHLVAPPGKNVSAHDAEAELSVAEANDSADAQSDRVSDSAKSTQNGIFSASRFSGVSVGQW